MWKTKLTLRIYLPTHITQKGKQDIQAMYIHSLHLIKTQSNSYKQSILNTMETHSILGLSHPL